MQYGITNQLQEIQPEESTRKLDITREKKADLGGLEPPTSQITPTWALFPVRAYRSISNSKPTPSPPACPLDFYLVKRARWMDQLTTTSFFEEKGANLYQLILISVKIIPRRLNHMRNVSINFFGARY